MSDNAAETRLNTSVGSFVVRVHEFDSGELVSLVRGEVNVGRPLVRLHSACMFSESFGSQDCDCALQLRESMALIAASAGGVIVYLYQEGRGQGIANKVRGMNLMATGLTTVQAYARLGLEQDVRDFEPAGVVLRELGVSQTVDLISSNPRKRQALEVAGFQVVNLIELGFPVSGAVETYLRSKRDGLGHEIHRFDRCDDQYNA